MAVLGFKLCMLLCRLIFLKFRDRNAVKETRCPNLGNRLIEPEIKIEKVHLQRGFTFRLITSYSCRCKFSAKKSADVRPCAWKQ